MARILIPARFERVAAAFDADVAARMGHCESSGSEHSLVSSIDLSDMVKSFLERNGEEKDHDEMGDEEEKVQTSSQLSYCEKRDMLQALLACGDYERDMIRREAEIACAVVGITSSTDFKRKLMSRLRKNGLDAGLCKSRWEKTGRLKSGDYEYIDVNFSGERYIVEVFLASEFEIARPTIQYSSLLQVFPRIFVGKVEELKQVVKLMCSAIKGSMKTRDLHIPPWRRNVYMQAKWFSSYKRTTNVVSTRNASSTLSSGSLVTPLRPIRFEARPMKAQNCKVDYYVNKTGFRISHLTAALNSDALGM
ncbi:uncharacterized protein LOC130974506 [Arachis stenosperma]|uniref:uncharacterized protein LOC130974506 n=1 Tax=Arachis stenosperma TaxID=217475 RepID=UPI0025AC6D65|nr:uncharacterized protein LOC130974506 [Arachis stenosperma]